MRKKQPILLLIALIVFLQGCSFNVDLKSHSFSESKFSSERLLLSAVILPPKHMMNKNLYVYGTHIRLYPAFFTNIRNMYQNMFSNIKVLDKGNHDLSMYDVIIQAECDIIDSKELFVFITIIDKNNVHYKITRTMKLDSTSKGAMYFALTATIIGAPIAFNLSNIEREEIVNEALAVAIESTKSELVEVLYD